MSRPLRRLLSEGSFFLLLMACALLCGWRWLLAAALAAVVHEGGHLLLLRAFHAGRGRLRIDAAGLCWERQGRLLRYGQELTAALAGPAANLLAALALAFAAGRFRWETGYYLAGTQLVPGLFNLLPVLPLDGAQALELFLSWLMGPIPAARLTEAVSLLTLGLLLGSAVWFLALTGTGLLLLGTLALLGLSLREMGLVKEVGRE